jgi:hypothetical protein
MQCVTKINPIRDRSEISRRYGLGGVIGKDITLDGLRYRFECKSVDAMDLFMNTECVDALKKSELDLFLEFVKYEDGELQRDDLIALDHLFYEMVVKNKECNIIQGAICG